MTIRDELVTLGIQLDRSTNQEMELARINALYALDGDNEFKIKAKMHQARSEAFKAIMEKIDALRFRVEKGEFNT